MTAAILGTASREFLLSISLLFLPTVSRRYLRTAMEIPTASTELGEFGAALMTTTTFTCAGWITDMGGMARRARITGTSSVHEAPTMVQTGPHLSRRSEERR